ncbi:MAG: hypothetical protein HON98_11700 [Chloroflexi bacterium]|jgi:predicted hydrocarbon binding protein|nr:hypothetical protein [Chloroflexota bacterium]MBT3670739.1 hypothetical protein [Chloroflexota bacterium]MBT4003871.1 hypothetical protein [Chloroflexota bacterium]MBT4305107.1 hypothetical protein [Chloroflexota bacterium]MBT4533371.1 hypothetical protein [Chloroflexota bacterium]
MANDSSKILPKEALDVAIDAVSEILGEAGVNSVVKHANLDYLLVNGKVVDGQKPTFGDVGQVTEAFFDIYGKRGATAILKRTGRVQFQKWNEAYPTALSAAGLALKAMAPAARIKTTLNVVKLAAKHIVHVESEVKEDQDKIYFAAFQCPYCAGVHADQSYCLTAVGAIEAVTKWATGDIWNVKEISCLAMGNKACVFEISPT